MCSTIAAEAREEARRAKTKTHARENENSFMFRRGN